MKRSCDSFNINFARLEDWLVVTSWLKRSSNIATVITEQTLDSEYVLDSVYFDEISDSFLDSVSARHSVVLSQHVLIVSDSSGILTTNRLPFDIRFVSDSDCWGGTSLPVKKLDII